MSRKLDPTLPLKPTKLVFLQGAGGNPLFWKPVADQLLYSAVCRLMGLPSMGDVPPDPGIRKVPDLAALVVEEIDQPTALIAQSMGGIVAVHAALERLELVTHLILAATSGGIDLADIQTEDWRPEFLKANPVAPRWFTEYEGDATALTAPLQMPVLLLWDDADLISPVSVGLRLCPLVPICQMHVVCGGQHDFANKFAARVAPLIDQHTVHLPDIRSTQGKA
jgi:poly(3-hydroxyoctanoate) depolymerase